MFIVGLLEPRLRQRCPPCPTYQTVPRYDPPQRLSGLARVCQRILSGEAEKEADDKPMEHKEGNNVAATGAYDSSLQKYIEIILTTGLSISGAQATVERPHL